jgi:hypothetical protein
MSVTVPVSESFDMFSQQNIKKLEAADQFGDLNIELINRQSFRVDQGDLVED